MTPRDATPWARARHATIAKDDRARVDGFTCDSTARSDDRVTRPPSREIDRHRSRATRRFVDEGLVNIF